MCTVTFLPLNASNFLLTSNRDEHRGRETFPPKKYKENGVELLFPKDKTAGGTWIGTSSENRLVCVLNGAFNKHVRKPNYQKSRGVLAKEILKTKHLIDYIKNLELSGVEPFTMVIVDWNNQELKLYEFIWDDHQIHLNELGLEPKIWSSSTLYSEESKNIRKTWFNTWLKNKDFRVQNVLKFHHSEIGDKTQSVLMKRPNVETVSITNVHKTDNEIQMTYEDVIHQKLIKARF